MMASDSDVCGALDGEEGWGVRTSQPQLQLLSTTTAPANATLSDLGRGYGGSSYGGGGGGRSRAIRKSSKKSSLPYERPAVGRSAASGPQAVAILSAASTQALAEKAQGEGAKAWLGSGFSKIISTGATYLYSSIFKRNPPLLPAPVQGSNVEAQHLVADEQIASPTVDAEDNQEGNWHNFLTEKPNHLEPLVVNSSTSDMEKLLKKTTLSRDEFQHLTELLQSRVVGNGVEKKQQPKQVEFNVRPQRQDVTPPGGNQSEAQRWRHDLQKSREERENAVRTLTVYENGGQSPATQAGATESLEALSSSPVEVAIAFMGGRSSRLPETPSIEPLNQQEENRMSGGPPPPNASDTTLAKWTAPDFLNEDQFSTPRPPSGWSRGHVRTISRTPYSRPLRLPPSRERAIDGTFGIPSATRWTPIRTPVTGGREMLKRRSTVLDEGWSSGGPIRRTRHKALVSVAPSNLSQSRGLAFPGTPRPSSSLLTLPSPIGARRIEGTPVQRNAVTSSPEEKNALPASGSFYVPAQSSETARKILETLEKMTPSPKGKSLGDELAYVRERPPTALTEGMLNDQARKSMSFIDFPSTSDSQEPGPSGRSAEEDSPNFPLKMSDSSTKLKWKGKTPLPPTKNGPGGPGLLAPQERTGTPDGHVKQKAVRPKEPVAAMASESDKNRGFRMSAVFEESGSEDEGRLFKKTTATLPVSTPKLPSATSISSTVTSPVSGAATSSPATSTRTGLPSFSPSVPAVDTSKAFSSGFTFPTRASLEGPPTPKAMSPASTSPKATTAMPFFEFAEAVEPPVASGVTLGANSRAVKAASLLDNKIEFSFGTPTPVANVAQVVSKSKPPLDSSISTFKQSPPALKAPSSVAAPAMLPTFGSGGATATSLAPMSSKVGDTFSTPPASNTTPKVAAISSNSTPFGQLFASNSGSTEIAAGANPPTNLFSSTSGFGTAPVPSLFGSDKIGSSAAQGFGQLNAFALKNISSATDSQASGAKDSGTPSLDSERPQKRSMPSSFQQDLSKRQQSPPATTPGHTFTTFGTTLVTSAATPDIPVTFAAAGSLTTSAAQDMFSVPSLGPAFSSAASQTTAALPPAGGISPFAFGIPATSAGTMLASSASAGFGATPSFPSFPSSVFGTASSGSTFGLTPAPALAPSAFGSTGSTPAFGSTNAPNSVVGGFASEAVSQSPPTPAFGSGFTTQHAPSTSSSFSFGASSPAFSFGPSSASSSGSAFSFGPAGSFPFAANKNNAPPSPIFGLSSSVPAFGSTTNGTMANDVVVIDQSNMDDNSMAEEPSQMGGSVAPQPSIFDAPQASAGAGTFVFGAPGATGQPLFGAFSNPNPAGFAAAPANPFAATQPGGSLDFAGGSFTLGSGGDRPQRKMFKAKRTGAKRGK